MSNTTLDDIRARLTSTRLEFEAEFESQLETQRERFQYRLKRGKVRFENDVRILQRAYRVGLWSYIRRGHLVYVFTAPFIYGLIVPLVLLDLSVTLYQHVCFRIYGIPLVRRSDHVIIDRQHLAYLNALEKFNCVYCGYGNGVLAYARDIAGRTEAFWCPIKHARRAIDPTAAFDSFFDYGDAESYSSWREAQRDVPVPERHQKP